MKQKISASADRIKKQVIPVLVSSLLIGAFPAAGYAAEDPAPVIPEETAEIMTVTSAESQEAMALLRAEESSVQVPSADVPPGMYRGPQTVELTAEAGADIYYTTNNMLPDENDTKYETPITVTEDTNICAIAVKDTVKSAPVTFGYFIRDANETPEMQFMVMSDIEIGDDLMVPGGTTDVYQIDKPRVFKAMAVTKSIFDDPDLLVMNGDIIKQNDMSKGYPDKTPDHATFIQLMKDAMSDAGLTNTAVQVTMGNHDSYVPSLPVSSMRQYYQAGADDWFPSDDGYYHKKLNGFDFLYLNSNSAASAQQTWFKNEMAAIQEAQTKAGKADPIFIFLHIPIKGSLDDQNWNGNPWLADILSDYPQAVVFSGHTHKTITEDRSIGQNAGFTAVNEGTMTYAESTEKGILSHAAGHSVQDIYQYPVAQCAAVEVYADRIEINRVTVNGDSGNAAANGYVPKEPFNNCGFIAGDKWVIPRADSTESWKTNFKYKPDQRKAAAYTPVFADGAKPVLTGTDRTATVTLPQTTDAQKTHYYLIELVDESGKTGKSIKVRSENVFSPIPKTLTYSIGGLTPETAYTAKVTAYNEYGAASDPIVSDTAYPVPALPGIKPALLTNENYDTALTAADETGHAVPYISAWSGGKGSVSYENGRATFVAGDTAANCDMRIPFQKRPNANRPDGETGDLTPIADEFFVEYDFKLEAASQGVTYLQLSKGDKPAINLQEPGTAAGGNTILYTASTITWHGHTASGLDLKNTPAKVRIRMGIANGTAYVNGFWVNGNLVDGSTRLGQAADGWTQIQFNEYNNSKRTVGSKLVSVDNFKVWKTTSAQVQEILQKGEDNLTFNDVKGENTAEASVTQDLKLSDLIGTQTKNGLTITGWTSDNEAVIKPDGTVIRPAFQGDAATVTLRPLLGMIDLMGETDQDYVSVPGAAISVTVPDLGQDPLAVATTGYIANEDFSQARTEADHATTVIPYVEIWSKGGKGRVDLSTGEGGAAKWVSEQATGGHDLFLPFQPGTTVTTGESGTKTYTPQPLLGEFTYEFDVSFLSGLNGGGLTFYLRNGENKNIAKLRMTATQASYYYYDYDEKTSKDTPVSIAAKSISGDSHKIKMDLGTDGDIQYLGSLWIDNNLIYNAKQAIADYPSDKGWRAIATGLNGNMAVGDFCSIDNIKCYRSAEDQAKELAAAEDGQITFDQISGSNTAPDSVASNLDLKAGETGALLTKNNLLVMGWTSDRPDVISTDGTVTPQDEDVRVQLTPSLAIRDSETRDYVEVSGEPIIVTVLKKLEPLDVATTGYIANEDFTTPYTETTSNDTVLPFANNYVYNSVLGDSKIAFSSGENGVATWSATNLGGHNLGIPFQPGATLGINPDKGNATTFTAQPLNGEFTFEFDINFLDGLSNQKINIYARNASGKNVARVELSKNTAAYKYSDANGNAQALTNTVSINNSNSHRVRMTLGTEGDVPYLNGLWVDNIEVYKEKMLSPYTAAFNAAGWTVLMAEPASTFEKKTYCSIDNIKCYRSPEDQAKEMAAADAGKISFNQIKGENQSYGSVTAKLDLKAGEAGRLLTENKMLVMGWTSDKPNVIKDDGTVIPPVGKDVDVKLTPQLAIKNADTGDYILTDGAQIAVTVKGALLGFTDADGNQAKVLNQSVAQGIANVSGYTGQVRVIAALYHGDMLEDVWTGDAVAADTAETAEVAVTGLPSDLTGRTMKLFVWEDETLIPLCSPAKIDAN